MLSATLLELHCDGHQGRCFHFSKKLSAAKFSCIFSVVHAVWRLIFQKLFLVLISLSLPLLSPLLKPYILFCLYPKKSIIVVPSRRSDLEMQVWKKLNPFRNLIALMAIVNISFGKKCFNSTIAWWRLTLFSSCEDLGGFLFSSAILQLHCKYTRRPTLSGMAANICI